MSIDLTALSERHRGTLAELLGLQFIEASPDRVVAELSFRDALTTVGGSLHGGALMALADTVGAAATMLNLPSGASTTTIESKTNFFAAGRSGIVRAEATPCIVASGPWCGRRGSSTKEGACCPSRSRPKWC